MTVQGKPADSREPVRSTVGVTGVGMTVFTKADDRSLLNLLTVAWKRALSDANCPPDELDAVYVGNMAAEAFNGRSGLANALAANLGAIGVDGRRIENTNASGASAFLTGFDAIRTGRARCVLVVDGEKLSVSDTETATEIISRITHDTEYEHGITLPSFAGLAADYYLRTYGVDRAELALIAVKNHANASANPYAQFDDRVTVEEVLESPKVATPLRLYDCCPTSDGAAAAVLEADDGDVVVTACESATGVHAIGDRSEPLEIEGVRAAGDAAFAIAGIGLDDIDVTCIHDAFTILEWLEMEELGFVKRGEAWRLTRDGQTDVDGSLPVNPSGGLKARGHPLGATGLSQIVELVWQLRGDAPAERSVEEPECGLAINVAGFGNNSVCTILARGADV